jgi:predicted GNAT family N-acyltransferase
MTTKPDSVYWCGDSDCLENIIQLRYDVLRKPWQQSKDTASDDLEGSSFNAYIKNERGEFVACGRLQKNSTVLGQIRYMAVAEDCRGLGYGKRVLQFLEEKAKAEGVMSIELQARENALDFYVKNGYHVKEKSFLLWGIIQHYLMEKKLT